MKERYTLFKTNCTFSLEKRFNLTRLEEEFPNIVHQFTTRNWMPFVDAPVDFILELVMELYALYQAIQDSMGLRGPVENFPNLTLVLVQGVEVDIIPKVISSLFWDEKISKGSMYIVKIATRSSQLQWVANTIKIATRSSQL